MTATTTVSTSTKPARKARKIVGTAEARIAKQEAAKRFETACGDVRNAVSNLGTAHETLVARLVTLAETYAAADKATLLQYVTASGKRPKPLQGWGDQLKKLVIPTWYSRPELFGAEYETLSDADKAAFKKGMAEEKILTNALPVAVALTHNRAIPGVSRDMTSGTVLLTGTTETVVKAAREALGIKRNVKPKVAVSTPVAPAPVPAGNATATAKEPAPVPAPAPAIAARATIARLADTIREQLTDWASLSEDERKALALLGAVIAERQAAWRASLEKLANDATSPAVKARVSVKVEDAKKTARTRKAS